MLLEYTAKQLEKHQQQLDKNIHDGLMIEMLEKGSREIKERR
jgi:hypothetical protein